MPFCSNCGIQLPDGAKFCSKCGTLTNNDNTKRKTVYDGEIHKCPNCGEVLDSFTTICPQCGFELRGVKAVNSVRELAIKLESIESKRIPDKKRKNYEPNEIDEEKINLIRNFPIPNVKEDLYEFFFLAKSNIDINSYKGGYNQKNIAISDAWMAKFEQAYQKLQLLFSDELQFIDFNSMYTDTLTKVKKAKRHNTVSLIKIYSALMVIIIAWAILHGVIGNSKELARLEAIVSKTEEALKNGEYKLALMYAETIEYDTENEDLRQDWDIKREYLIDRILNEAAEKGIVLEYDSQNEYNPDSQKYTEQKTTIVGGFIYGVISGFDKAFESHKDAIQSDIDKFNENLKEESSNN